MKPSSAEEEYFKKQEAQKLRKLREEATRKLSEEQRRQAKELHYMKCPKCGMELQEFTFKNVTLDKCFTCGGVWVDQGELAHIAPAEAIGFLTSLRNIFK